MKIFVLLVILQGWGNGTGSSGNAVASIEFSDRAHCEVAKKAILDLALRQVGGALCLEK